MTGFVGDVGGGHDSDSIFKASDTRFGSDFFLALFARGSATVVLLMLVSLVTILAIAAIPSIKTFGLSFLTTSRWSPEHEENKHEANGNVVREEGELVKITVPGQFGALAVIYGTVVSSILALLLAVPLSLGAALFLVRIGPWLTPMFVKCGILGMLLTLFLMLIMSRSPAMVFLAVILGIGLTGLLMWVAWKFEDPRLGTRWVMEIPVYIGILLFGAMLFHAIGGGSWPASAIAGALISGPMYFLAPSIVAIISFLIEFLAAIPSIAYGIWGLFVVVPFLQGNLEPLLNRFFGWVPFLRFLHTEDFPTGRDMFCAGLILGIMIVPIITAISRDVLRAVPRIQIEGTQALGATWWQSSWAMLRYGRSGLFGAVMLGLARAAGETMAVAMVIGNAIQIDSSIFKAAQTMSSLLANEFAEASSDLHRSALVEVALILLIMSLTFNVVARYLVVGGQVKASG